MGDTQEIIRAAADILTRRYGGEQQLVDVERLDGSGLADVFRARVVNNPFFQHRSVVVKHSPATGDELADAAFLRETVAYQFATSLSEEVRPGPVLLGYDTAQRILIISDLGDGRTLADLLQDADPETHVDLLRRLGRALGKMHAGTADDEDAFNVLFQRMTRSRKNAANLQLLRDRLLSHRIRIGVEFLENAGIEIPGEVRFAATNVRTRLLRGGMRAFTPFDLTPDNVIQTDNSFHFLDYEWAGFRDVTFDVAFVVARFPVYLAAQPFNAEATEAFVDAWVSEVRGIWPSVEHPDTLQARITAGLIGWAMSSVAMLDPVSPADLLEHDAKLKEDFDAAGLDVSDLGPLEAGGETEEHPADHAGDVLRPYSEGPFTADEALVRRDLRETFESLAAFAGTGKDPAYQTINHFAQTLAERLR
ncbi:phosphotransferase [Corynebacterium afermentans subsp. lipophilum]|uniref:phosphotransferase n=1 Tax=Corynebacterium afermentans TaxID=38286 RepID=UPI00188BB8B5|nr:phosphotransferase [Corynebacterium afermentans]MBF4546645.1 phosphotransferase [Corynebacterium afermentans subsp. lipophilum]WJY59006.1 Phosphotransferase enzyme family protein [Corynebacterium afermentans subsp. lipophilum]